MKIMVKSYHIERERENIETVWRNYVEKLIKAKLKPWKVVNWTNE